MLQEKQFYLSCLEAGPMCQRSISNRLSTRFTASPAAIRDALLLEGLIELSHIKREGATQKINHYYKLTGKKLAVPKKNGAKQIQVPSKFWEDGTPKSQNNAFNWSDKKCSLFSKTELSQMHQKYHNNMPITVYSRA